MASGFGSGRTPIRLAAAGKIVPAPAGDDGRRSSQPSRFVSGIGRSSTLARMAGAVDELGRQPGGFAPSGQSVPMVTQGYRRQRRDSWARNEKIAEWEEDQAKRTSTSQGRLRPVSRMDRSRSAIASTRSGCWAATFVVSPRSWARS